MGSKCVLIDHASLGKRATKLVGGGDKRGCGGGARGVKVIYRLFCTSLSPYGKHYLSLHKSQWRNNLLDFRRVVKNNCAGGVGKKNVIFRG